MNSSTVADLLVSDKTRALLQRGADSKRSFAEFCRFVLGFEPAAHQREWVEALQDVADHPEGNKLCIVAPPGSGKTTLMVGFMAYMIGRLKDDHFGLFSYADQVGWARSRAVKELLVGSKPYHVAFPDIGPSPAKWGDKEFIVKRKKLGDPHPTLRAGGMKSSVVAYRLDGRLVDDPHDPKDAATPTLREKVFDNYEKALRTRLTQKAWQVVIGTRWADDDFIGQLTKQKGWRVLHTQAIRPNGTSYWPDGYSHEYLASIRFESPSLFAIQYMGDTTGGETGIIQRISTYNDSPSTVLDSRDLLIGAGWDTAFKEKQQNDFTVGYIGGLDPDGRIYILDRVKGRWGLPGLLDQLSRAYVTYGPAYVWIEDAASGTPAIQALMESSPHIPTVPVAYRGGKTTRAHALAPFLHGGHVLFPKGADWYKDAEYSLTHFPHIRHDDDIDALFMLVDNLSKCRHPSRIERRPQFRLVMS